MPVDITSAIAKDIQDFPHPLYLLWHGGEPLSCGLRKFRELVAPFSHLRIQGRVRHSLQTNATLITSAWCQFFKDEQFRVGVSLDGTEGHNSNRLGWNNKSSFSAARRGIEELRRNGIKFGIITVVNQQNIDDPEGLYNFLLSLGACGLNFNIEEREGLNQLAADLDPQQVRIFWRRLFAAWRANPIIPIREFENGLGWMLGVCNGPQKAVPRPGDIWPTVSASGDVVVLSPEFMGAKKNEVTQFIVGNVLKDSLREIVKRCRTAKYVQDYFAGKSACQISCSYYSYCGGGQPSNKYFELGTLNGTETAHCRNTRQAVIDTLLSALSDPLGAQIQEGETNAARSSGYGA